MLLSLLACLASSAVLPIAHSHVLRKRAANEPCGTEECNQYAQRISNGMNLSVDPCENFYNYVCGSWHVHNPIPDDKIGWSTFALMKKLTNERLLEIMSEPINPESPEAVKKAQRFYRSCMDTERIEKKGIQPLAQIVNEKGGWPIAMPAESWSIDESWFDLEEFYYRISGALSVISINYETDDSNSSRFVISVGQYREFPFGNKYKNLKAASTRNKYLDSIVKSAKIFAGPNAKLSSKQLMEDAATMVYFEHFLQNLTLVEDETLKTYRMEMSILELQQMYDEFGSGPNLAEFQIDWLKMIRRVFKDVTGVTITHDTQIYVHCKKCLHKMADIFRSTSKRTIVNYIHWVFISTHMTYANQQLRDISYDVAYLAYKDISKKPRWEECIEDLPLKDGMGLLFVQRFIKPEVVTNALDMTDAIRDEVRKDVEKISWANDAMKQYMTDKLDHLNEQIGYPHWYNNETAVKNLYKNVEIGPDYFQNIITFTSVELVRQLQFLSTGFPSSEWIDYPITVNAFYFGPANAIILPAAEIQEPFFVNGIPNAVNYGGIGIIVGHEVGHGLDNHGIHYNKDGNRLGDGIQELLEQYNQRAQCFVDQFSSYTLDQKDEKGNLKHLDGVLTQGENIADTIGVIVSYKAFQQKQQQDTTTPATLKNFPNLNADKLFFVSFAAQWCFHERQTSEEFFHDDLDEHSPPNLRVNGALSNSKDFAETFQCPEGSPMNPANKCSLWNTPIKHSHAK